MASSHNLTVSQVLAYVQMKDFQLKRMKKNYLEKSIAASLKVIRQDETEEFGDRENGIGDELEAENDRECENDLMEVKDLNAINKSVVSLWNQEKIDGESDGVNNEEGQQADTTELLKGNKRKAKDLAKTQLKKQKKNRLLDSQYRFIVFRRGRECHDPVVRNHWTPNFTSRDIFFYRSGTTKRSTFVALRDVVRQPLPMLWLAN